MKVRLHIDALALEADWPRSARPAFAARLHEVLALQIAAAARRGAFTAAAGAARKQLIVPASALASPASAASGLGRSIVGAIENRAPTVGGGRGR